MVFRNGDQPVWERKEQPDSWQWPPATCNTGVEPLLMPKCLQCETPALACTRVLASCAKHTRFGFGQNQLASSSPKRSFHQGLRQTPRSMRSRPKPPEDGAHPSSGHCTLAAVTSKTFPRSGLLATLWSHGNVGRVPWVSGTPLSPPRLLRLRAGCLQNPRQAHLAPVPAGPGGEVAKQRTEFL